jgi:hypothetical protein
MTRFLVESDVLQGFLENLTYDQVPGCICPMAMFLGKSYLWLDFWENLTQGHFLG